MGYPRTERIGEEIKKLVSNLIRNELKDPRISPLTSIVDVEVTRDLRYANIFVSVYGTEEDRENTINALSNACGFVRKEMGKKLKLRYTPEPIFKKDLSIEKGLYISSLLNRVNPREDTSEDKGNEKSK